MNFVEKYCGNFAACVVKCTASIFKTADSSKRSKASSHRWVKNTITFDDYLQCLRENTIISRGSTTFARASTFCDLIRRGKLHSVLTTTNAT
ncbi:unnamed protein product [Trichogramma brassicae]|uniref:Uncharacterized protein n=1 Tax=Trichogramma brassicae TaxID=86971 RepID=A0A6H5J1E5_9HYME|nr:unnamed protein product [Trichogramma brassicae]